MSASVGLASAARRVPVPADEPLVRRRPDPERAVVTTYVFFARPAATRANWTVVAPLHRRVAPSLLEWAAAAEVEPADAALSRR